MDYRLIVIGVVCIASFVNSEEFDIHVCKRHVAKTVKRQLGLISECVNTMEFKNKNDRAAKIACILKCAAIKEKLLTPEGALSRPMAEEYIATLPEFLHQRATTMMDICFGMAIGDNVPDVEELYCRTYTPFIKCFLDGTSHMCDEPKKEAVKA